MAASLDAFITAWTRLQPAGLVPEIGLHLAADAATIFEAAAAREGRKDGSDRQPPYWAFAWPGGQAMARHLLDHPAPIAGRRVLDIGAGSGIAAIAARIAGASHVLAADTDPMAEAAIRLNAAANGLDGRLATTTADMLGRLPDADLVIISDLVYEPELAMRVGAFLDMAAAAGLPVLLGDRMTSRRPAAALTLLGAWRAGLLPPLMADSAEDARVWRLEPRGYGRKRGH